MEDNNSTSTRTVKAERERIIRMWQQGSSARVISQATGISVSTVHRWVRRWREEGTVNTRPYNYTKLRFNSPPPYTYVPRIPTANVFDNPIISLPISCTFNRRNACSYKLIPKRVRLHYESSHMQGVSSQSKKKLLRTVSSLYNFLYTENAKIAVDNYSAWLLFGWIMRLNHYNHGFKGTFWH